MRHENPTFNQCLNQIRTGGEIKAEGSSDYSWEIYGNMNAFITRFPDDSFYEDEFGEGWKKIKLVHTQKNQK